MLDDAPFTHHFSLPDCCSGFVWFFAMASISSTKMRRFIWNNKPKKNVANPINDITRTRLMPGSMPKMSIIMAMVVTTNAPAAMTMLSAMR